MSSPLWYPVKDSTGKVACTCCSNDFGDGYDCNSPKCTSGALPPATVNQCQPIDPKNCPTSCNASESAGVYLSLKVNPSGYRVLKQTCEMQKRYDL